MTGWDDDGIFNFEGGCYAKTINLSHENEPEIYDAIKRDALLENVIIKVTGLFMYMLQHPPPPNVAHPLRDSTDTSRFASRLVQATPA